MLEAETTYFQVISVLTGSFWLPALNKTSLQFQL